MINTKCPLGLSVPIVAFHSDPLGPLKFHCQGSCPRLEHLAEVPGAGGLLKVVSDRPHSSGPSKER